MSDYHIVVHVERVTDDELERSELVFRPLELKAEMFSGRERIADADVYGAYPARFWNSFP